ncbi:capsular polysaccharide synthesis protein [Rhizosphaericola mali]|uniref:Capsular biosynthesis protein n=1 Tax=Rhizosphaericola mali TaxID=2545455 RepID=A0A5P2G066_9BACT|nr:capsular polysaccharide synthesis protein [Rhizosphaericola mali]QES89186.1 capsular biosynthesis protein [Rhizosphaericola mali]
MNKISSFILNNSLVKKGWALWREQKIFKTHKEVSNFCDVLIEEYYNGDKDNYLVLAKQKGLNQNVIWQYWGQGFEKKELPDMVQFCLDSVDKFKGNYQVIRIDDNNIKEYIDFPSFVWEKKNDNTFNRTFFSDLLRLALLNTYGGVWLDATILLTKQLPNFLSDNDYFVYQRSDAELHKDYWKSTYAFYWGWNPKFKVRMLNSIFAAQRGSCVINALFNLTLTYWKTQSSWIDYFFSQILYQQLITGRLKNYKCKILSDTIPHLLQTKINNGYKYNTYNEILDITGIHKLSYKDKCNPKMILNILQGHS